ncbi:zinc ribbon domain-containing protein [Paraburkholderia bonniea]|uniref:FmdB family zinc ribbon protein n=1 Tax=Paraburkholderia bonniea TaxID=2152891 RepID=UPI00129216C0|nr:FmdB family zinc ribbon protein [Paraburkholderia bonniea]WJF90698.1 zinc ribbon domain-containing protein [Paraburkholderia bonniea]WJF94011.1 zinc ribbon domain-containing protein [Paraburkholderia bonniea]
MPIYAYRCESCGFAKDVLQKMSDTPLHQCPECGKDAFRKQVTAAGFQLKGSGWYVTDFRSNGSAPASAKPAANAEAGEGSASAAASESSSTGAATDGAASTAATGSTSAAAPAATSAPAPAPAAASTTGGT